MDGKLHIKDFNIVDILKCSIVSTEAYSDISSLTNIPLL